MVSTAIQLFTVCESSDPFPAILDSVVEAGYDGVEYNEEWFPMGDYANDSLPHPDPTTRPLQTAGVQVPLSTLENHFEGLYMTYEKFSCRDYIVPYLEEECVGSQTALQDTADRLNAVAERLAEKNVRLHYHNHDFEFNGVDGRLAFDRLVEATNGVRFEIDVGWVAAADKDPVDVLKTYADVIDIVHLKDMHVANGTPAQLGMGDVDLESCVDATREIGAEWLVYEYDWPEDPEEAISHGGSWFQHHLQGNQNGT